MSLGKYLELELLNKNLRRRSLRCMLRSRDLYFQSQVKHFYITCKNMNKSIFMIKPVLNLCFN